VGWQGYAEKEGLSLKVRSEEVMGDDSGESKELMEEVPLIRLGESELEKNEQ